MVSCRPGELSEHNRFSPCIASDRFTCLRYHPKRPAQERGFAGEIIAHLLLEIVARHQFQIHAYLLHDGSLLRRQSTVGMEERGFAAPGNIRHDKRCNRRHLFDGNGPDCIGETLLRIRTRDKKQDEQAYQ